MIFTIILLFKIEQKNFKEIGWKSTNIIRDIGIGIAFCILLLIISTILMITAQIIVLTEINITFDKFFTALFFALGAIYEDCLFRGYFQQELEKTYSSKKSILIQSLTFLFINLFYFPFDISGIINYIVLFIMAIIIGFLAKKYSLYSANATHFFFILIAGLLI